MKNGKLLIPALLLLSITLMPLLGNSVVAQTKAERKTAIQRVVDQRIVDRNLEFEVSRAVPAKGSSISLSGDYSLIIRNDSVISYLPYYGRVYIGGGGSLTFSEKMEDYSLYKDKKQYKMEFTARTPKETYKFRMQIGIDGSGSVSVDSNNRQGITFIGELDTTQEERR